jgi:hypothetical protein
MRLGTTEKINRCGANNRASMTGTLFFALMDEPEYLICLECETPTYQFEFGANGKLLSVICNTCGNDSPSEFMTENELEEQSGP